MNKSYHEVVKKLHFDMHTPVNIENVGKNLDVDSYVAAIKASGAESVTLFARCAYGFAYTRTDIAFPHPNMEADVFKLICTALRKENIDVTAYIAACVLSDEEVAKKGLRDWLTYNEDGNLYNHGKDKAIKNYICPTSEYYYENLLPYIVELAKNNDINAVWIDGLYHGLNEPCYCDRCKKLFMEEVPQANADMTSMARFRWSNNIIYRFLDDVGKELMEINPKISVGADVVGCIKWPIPISKNTGFYTYDPQPPNLVVSAAMNLAGTAWRGKTIDMNIQRMRSWQDFNCRAPQTLKAEAALCASMNSMLIAGDIVKPIDIQPDMESMKHIRAMFDYGEAIYHKVKNVPSYADVAILLSVEQMRLNGGRWALQTKFIEGAYQMVTENGLTSHILYDADLKEHLAGYRVLLVAEHAYIEKSAAAEIEKFVAAGGNLVVVGTIPGAVGEFERDDQADTAIFEKLCGVTSAGMLDEPIAYIKIKDTMAEKYWNLDFTPEIGVYGKATLAKATTAVVETPLYYPAPVYQIGARPIGKKSEYAGITKNKFGQGNVTYVSLPIALDYMKFGNFMEKRLLGEIIKANVDAYAQLTGCSNSILAVAKNTETVCVGVVVVQNNLNNEGMRVADGTGKIAEIKVTIKDARPIKAIESVLDEVNVAQENGVITIALPPTDIYNGVILKF